MSKKIFISYSHADEEWKEKLITHLKPLARCGFPLEPWHDEEIMTGQNIEKTIFNAMDESLFAILLLSDKFLASDFINEKEIPYLIEKEKNNGLIIFPFLISPCLWKSEEWLKKRLIKPKDAKELIGLSRYEQEKALQNISEEILEIVNQTFKEDIEVTPPSEPFSFSADSENSVHENSKSFAKKSFVVKKILNEFYGESIPDLASAFADRDNPSYQDVFPENPFFPYIEIAKGLAIIKEKNEFKPNEIITKSEALRILILTSDTPDVLLPIPNHIVDISHHKNKKYVISAYNNGILIDYQNKDEILFEPDAPLLISELEKWTQLALKQNEKIIRLNKEIPCLEVSVSKETPPSKSIPMNGTNIPMLALDFSNSTTEDISLCGIIIAHGGLGHHEDISAVKIFDGIRQMGKKIPFISGSEIAPIGFSEEETVITAGTTKTVVAAVDLKVEKNNSGSEHSLSLMRKEDIIAVNKKNREKVEIIGKFPLHGEKFGTANVNVGKLCIGLLPHTISFAAEQDAQNTIFSHLIITAKEEDVLLQCLPLVFEGIEDGDIENVFLFGEEDQFFSKTEQFTKNKEVIFDLTGNKNEGLLIKKESPKILGIIGIPKTKGKIMQISLRKALDSTLAYGLTYGFGVEVEISGISPLIQII